MADINYIDKEYLKKLWERVKNIPDNSEYTLNDKSQTINDAINELGENKQDKVDNNLMLREEITNVVDAINKNNENTYDLGYEAGYRWDNYMCEFSELGTDKDPLKGVTQIRDTMYDPSTVILGEHWWTPSSTQWSELFNNTTFSTMTSGGNSYLKLTGKNGNYIIFGNFGHWYDDTYSSGSSTDCLYWSSTKSDNQNAYATDASYDLAILNKDDVLWYHLNREYHRKSGMQIRPVTNYASSGVDLGLPSGTRWASANLKTSGLASSYAVPGDFFAFGEIIDKSTGKSDMLHKYNDARHVSDEERMRWNNGITVEDLGEGDFIKIEGGTISSLPQDKVVKYKLTPSDDCDDAAHAILGDGWRMPTYNEMNELCNNCDWTYNTINGVEGFTVKSKVSGNNNSIFLPITGRSDDQTLQSARYWTSTRHTSYPQNAYRLVAASSSKTVIDGVRWYGLAIRPVSETYGVDLGLSVKWAESNLCDDGLCENVYDKGDYYAWGETSTKTSHTSSNYKFGTSPTSPTKYNNSDNKRQLDYGTVSYSDTVIGVKHYDDILTKKDVNKYIPEYEGGFGVEIEDNTVDSEVEFKEGGFVYDTATFTSSDGYGDTFFGREIWEDRDGNIYNGVYKLNTETNSFERQTFNGLEDVFTINGSNFWHDTYIDYYYDSDANQHYYYIKNKNTWRAISLNISITDISKIWYDGVYVYYNNYYKQGTSTLSSWGSYSFSNIYNFDAQNIWYYKDDIYYSASYIDCHNVSGNPPRYTSTYKYNKATKSWTELTDWVDFVETKLPSNNSTYYSGAYIVELGNNVYYFKDNLKFKFNWDTKKWIPYESDLPITTGNFGRDDFWSDGKNIYYSNARNYKIELTDNEYITRHGDVLQNKLVGGDGIIVKRGVVSLDGEKYTTTEKLKLQSVEYGANKNRILGYGLEEDIDAETGEKTVNAEVECVEAYVEGVEASIFKNTRELYVYDYFQAPNGVLYQYQSNYSVWKFNESTEYFESVISSHHMEMTRLVATNHIWQHPNGDYYYCYPNDSYAHYRFDTASEKWVYDSSIPANGVSGAGIWYDNDGNIYSCYNGSYYKLDGNAWVAADSTNMPKQGGTYVKHAQGRTFFVSDNKTYEFADGVKTQLSDIDSDGNQMPNAYFLFVNDDVLWVICSSAMFYKFVGEKWHKVKRTSDNIPNPSSYTSVGMYAFEYNGGYYYSTNNKIYQIKFTDNEYVTRHGDVLQKGLKGGDGVYINGGKISVYDAPLGFGLENGDEEVNGLRVINSEVEYNRSQGSWELWDSVNTYSSLNVVSNKMMYDGVYMVTNTILKKLIDGKLYDVYNAYFNEHKYSMCSLWKNVNGDLYWSSGSDQYQIIQGSFVVKDWGTKKPTSVEGLWTDNDGHTYYSYNNAQYELVNGEFVNKDWGDLYPNLGVNVWKLKDHIYCTYRTQTALPPTHLELVDGVWVVKNWGGYSNKIINGRDIWVSNDTAYYSYTSTDYYMLVSDEWIPNKWDGLSLLVGRNVFRDDDGNTYCLGNNYIYTLKNNENTYTTRHDNKLQTLLTPGFGTVIQDDTISSEVKFSYGACEWREYTWVGDNNRFNVSKIWKDGDNNFYYSEGESQWKLVNGVWVDHTWEGGLYPEDGHFVWRNVDNNIYYTKFDNTNIIFTSLQLVDGVWVEKEWDFGDTSQSTQSFVYGIFSSCYWFDDGEKVYRKYINSGTQNFVLSNNKWERKDIANSDSLYYTAVWKDLKNNIYYSNGDTQLKFVNGEWVENTDFITNGLRRVEHGNNVWRDDNNLYLSDYYAISSNVNGATVSALYYFNAKLVNGYWSELDTLRVGMEFAGQNIWYDGKIVHCDYGNKHYYLYYDDNKYYTRHNDILQTKLYPGRGIKIVSGVIMLDENVTLGGGGGGVVDVDTITQADIDRICS